MKRLTRSIRAAALALAIAASCAAAAQDFAHAQVTGHVGVNTQDAFASERDDVDFTCTGTPTCIGSYQGTVRRSNCRSGFVMAGTFSLTGIDISKPGNFQGSITLPNWRFSDIVSSDGACSIRPGSISDAVLPYRASWDGSSGTIVFLDSIDGAPLEIPGTFKADVAGPPPVFPMTVAANIDDKQATASAQISFARRMWGRRAACMCSRWRPGAS